MHNLSASASSVPAWLSWPLSGIAPCAADSPEHCISGFLGRDARCIIRGNIGYYEAYDQIQTAKKWAQKSYVDEDHMAIWGWSYGGYLTLKVLEQDAGQTFRYGVAVAPVTDWLFYGKLLDLF